MGVPILNKFMGGCGCLRLFKADLWVGLSSKKKFIYGCNYLEDIYGWVGLFRAHLWMDVSGCDCLKHIYWYVRILSWVGVGVCDC